MKHILALLALLGLWFLVSVDWYVCYIKKECVAPEKVEKVLETKAVEQQVVSTPVETRYNALYFSKNSSNGLYSEDSFLNESALLPLRSSDASQKEFSLSIVGMSYADEGNEDEQRILALQRADFAEDLLLSRFPNLKISKNIQMLSSLAPLEATFKAVQYRLKEIFKVSKRRFSIRGNVIHFPLASVKIAESQEIKSYIQKLFAVLEKSGDEAFLRIVGHTDQSGDEGLNLKLSRKRAQVVADLFVEEGFPEKRVFVSGVGSSQPLADNSSEIGRAKNRRVEVKVLKRK